MVDEDAKRTILVLVSYLLSYPAENAFWSLMVEANDCIIQLPESTAKNALLHAVGMLKHANRDALEKTYCEQFDFRESSSLYLTAHELGDSRKRGMAMVELRQMFAKDGFIESDADDLPDYIPRLFEFLAQKRSDLTTDDLEQRLVTVCKQIIQYLDKKMPYWYVMHAALTVLPQMNTSDFEEKFEAYEEADLDELPYPLYYQ